MTLILSEDEVRSCVDMKVLVDAVDDAMRAEAAGLAHYAPRVTLPAPTDGFLRMMGACVEGAGVLGYKVFNAGGSNGVRYMIGVHDVTTGDQLALMDAHYLTAARTGAVTGLATRWGARRDSEVIAVIGSGLEARTNLAGIAAALPLNQARIYSPTPENRLRFAKEMEERLGFSVTAYEDPEKAVQGADIVLVATSTRGRANPIAFDADWVRPGCHVSSIGSTHPLRREVDHRLFLSADRVLMDSVEEARSDSGDVATAVAEGLDLSRVLSLVDLYTGDVEFRTSDDQVTFFKSVGTAVQDVMAGKVIYERALELSLGTRIDFLGAKK